MTSSGCEGQGLASGFAVRQVRAVSAHGLCRLARLRHGEPWAPLLQLVHQFAQPLGGSHRERWDQGGFIGVVRGYQQRLGAFPSRQFGDGDHAPAWTQAAVQAQFPGTPESIQQRSCPTAVA